jgi:hypothetical protein
MATQQKIISTGVLTLGDKAYGHPVAFDIGFTLTGSTASTGSALSKVASGDYYFTSASWVPVSNTSSLSTVNLYFLQNKGTASFMVAGTSTGGALANPILDPGDFIILAYGTSSLVPPLYVRSMTTSASVATFGGIEL